MKSEIEKYTISRSTELTDVKEYIIESEAKIRKIDIGRYEVTSDKTFIIEVSSWYEADINKFCIDQNKEKPLPEIVETKPTKDPETIFKYDTNYINDLIYGKDKTPNIVSLDVLNDNIYLFKKDGTHEVQPMKYWLVSEAKEKQSTSLEGKLKYKHLIIKDTKQEYFGVRKYLDTRNIKYTTIANNQSSAFVINGYTLFKDTTLNEISVLSFDIETNGLVMDDTSEVFTISNTYRDREGNIKRKLFSVDEYDSDIDMIREWTYWVCANDPDIITGHNIISYDLPFLQHIADRYQYKLELGRLGEEMSVTKYTKKFRVDGSQEWEYNDIMIFGRQIIDTMFLSVKYDFKREFPSWGLKPIIKYLGLEKDDRVFVDSSKIAELWEIPEEREKIKQYNIDDSDDSLKLLDIMLPPFFYYCRSVPMTLQTVVNTATGKQLDTILIRSYLQINHSLPASTEKDDYQGAISFGVPGVYRNTVKWDVSSLYPSIIRQYKIFDRIKDPKQHFLNMVECFTIERLGNKKKANETGENYYKHLEQSQKLVINSSYGLCGTNGLLFNSPKNAALITKYGREILEHAMIFATDKGAEYWIGKKEEKTR